MTGHVISPVTLSFGWVAYAIYALLSAIGENRLIQCPLEIPLLAINLKSGNARAKQSWLLARLLKTYNYWTPEEVRTVLKNPCGFRDELEARGLSSSLSRDEKQLLRRQQSGSGVLCVAVYRWIVHKAGLPARDWVWWSGFAAPAIQLGVSVIPFGLYGDCSVFLITACGTLLAYASGSLPQWRQEKWHARK